MMLNHPVPGHAILSQREQARVTNEWLAKRIRQVLPAVMRREGIDMWIVSSREYNEDPVLLTLLPAPMMSARRRTILVFHAPNQGDFEALAIANAGIGLDDPYRPVWDKPQTGLAAETQEECLRRVVAERDPKRIGINYGTTFAFDDGLSHTDYEHLLDALGPDLAGHTVSAQDVAVGWLEARLPEELGASDTNNQIAHSIIAQAFSAAVIQPGVTRASDVAWWMRERTVSLGLSNWFHPSRSEERRVG